MRLRFYPMRQGITMRLYPSRDSSTGRTSITSRAVPRIFWSLWWAPATSYMDQTIVCIPYSYANPRTLYSSPSLANQLYPKISQRVTCEVDVADLGYHERGIPTFSRFLATVHFLEARSDRTVTPWSRKSHRRYLQVGWLGMHDFLLCFWVILWFCILWHSRMLRILVSCIIGRICMIVQTYQIYNRMLAVFWVRDIFRGVPELITVALQCWAKMPGFNSRTRTHEASLLRSDILY